jgi:hypothetical protein
MKPKLFLFSLLLCSFRAGAYPQITFHNIGTNVCQVIVWYSSNGDPGPLGTATLSMLAGATMVWSDGACGKSMDGVTINVRYGSRTGGLTNQYFDVHTFSSEPCGPGYNEYGPLNVASFSVPTNCTDTVSIPNPNPFAAGYQLYKNGIGAGVVYVGGGQTATMQFPNPGCVQNSWTYAQVAGGVYVDPTQSGGQQGNGWAYSPTGGYDAPLLTGPMPANATTSASPNGPQTQPPQAGSFPPEPPPQPFTNNPAQANTNGPVQYGTNNTSNPTNVVNNGTVQQMGNALYTVIVQGNQGVIDAIKEMDAANRRGHGGNSNLLQVVTNELGVLTNELRGLTNQEPATNDNPTGLAYNIWSNTIGAITNTVSGALSSMTNGWGSAVSGLNTNVAFGSPGDSYTFALPSMPDPRISTPSVVVSLSAVEAIQSLSAVKGVVAWVIVLGWFYKYCEHAEWAVQRLFAQRQSQGNKQMVEAATFGGNVSVVTALVYAGIFAAIIGIIPTVIAASTVDLSSKANSLMGNITTISSWPIWSFVNAVCPIDLVVYSFLNYLVFRFIICDLLLWVLLGIIFAMAE